VDTPLQPDNFVATAAKDIFVFRAGAPGDRERIAGFESRVDQLVFGGYGSPVVDIVHRDDDANGTIDLSVVRLFDPVTTQTYGVLLDTEIRPEDLFVENLRSAITVTTDFF
jgi:hypothetical protein